MKVKELIEKLSQMNLDAEVCIPNPEQESWWNDPVEDIVEGESWIDANSNSERIATVTLYP